MKRTIGKTLNLSSEHAAHALHVLVADGKIAATDVTRALKRREKMIRELRERLATLERGVSGGIGRKVRPARVRKHRKPISAARKAAMKAHGRYLGSIRPLSKSNRTKVKAIRQKEGVHAAIKAARTMAQQAAPGANPQRRAVQGTQPDYQSPQQRKLAAYQQRERRKPDKHGGSGAGRQQGGSGAGRERG